MTDTIDLGGSGLLLAQGEEAKLGGSGLLTAYGEEEKVGFAGLLVASWYGIKDVTSIPSAEAFGTPQVSTTTYEPPDPPEEDEIPGGRNWRIIIPSAQINTNGNYLRVSIRGGSSASTLGGCSIGKRSGTTDDYSETPTRITFNNGDHGITVPTRTTIVSDWIPFLCRTTENYLVHLYWAGTHYVVNWKNSGSYETPLLDPENETLIKIVSYDLVSGKSYSVSKIEVMYVSQTIEPDTIASAESFGTVLAETSDVPKTVYPIGISSVESFGLLTIDTDPPTITALEIYPESIKSEVGFGLLSIGEATMRSITIIVSGDAPVVIFSHLGSKKLIIGKGEI